MPNCPECGSAMVWGSIGMYRIQKCGGGCDLAIGFGRPFRLPDEPRMVKCEHGHSGSWVFRKVGKRVFWKCARVVRQHDSKPVRCDAAESEGQLQGFLAPEPEREPLPAFRCRDWICFGLYHLGPQGGYVQDLLSQLPAGFTAAQIYSGLARMQRYQYKGNLYPFVEKSGREPLPAGGYAARFKLSERGEAFCYARWPELRGVDDAWKAGE